MAQERDVTETLRQDLAALRLSTRQAIPPLECVADRLAADLDDRARPRPFFLRPRALVAVAIGLALLAIPFPHSRLTGFEVKVTVPEEGMSAEALRQISQQFQRSLDAMRVQVSLTVPTAGTSATPGESGAQAHYTLIAQTNPRSRRELENSSSGFIQGLKTGGVEAQAAISEIRKPVWGAAYAMIAERVKIYLRTRGRSPAEVAADVEAQLKAAGLHTKIQQVPGSDARVIFGTGKADREIELIPDPEEKRPLHHYRFRADRRGRTDDEVREEIQRQLQSLGVKADVTLRDGKIIEFKVLEIQRSAEKTSPP